MSILEARFTPPIICPIDNLVDWGDFQRLMTDPACKLTTYSERGTHPLPPLLEHPEFADCRYTVTVKPEGHGFIGISPAVVSSFFEEFFPDGISYTQYRAIPLEPGRIGYFIAEREGSGNPELATLYALYEYQPDEVR